MNILVGLEDLACLLQEEYVSVRIVLRGMQ